MNAFLQPPHMMNKAAVAKSRAIIYPSETQSFIINRSGESPKPHFDVKPNLRHTPKIAYIADPEGQRASDYATSHQVKR